MSFFVYILRCADNSYYTGITENLEQRLAQHQAGTFKDGYTALRQPIQLCWSQEFATHDEAFRRERQIKGWSRVKKEALMRGDWEALQQLAKNKQNKLSEESQ